MARAEEEVSETPRMGDVAARIEALGIPQVKSELEKASRTKLTPERLAGANEIIRGATLLTERGEDPTQSTGRQLIMASTGREPKITAEEESNQSNLAKALIGFGSTILGAAFGGAAGGAVGARAGLSGIENIEQQQEALIIQERADKKLEILEKDAEQKAAEKAQEFGLKKEALDIKDRGLALKEKKQAQDFSLEFVKASKQASGRQLSVKDVLLIQQGSQIPRTLDFVEDTILGSGDIFGPVTGLLAISPFATKTKTIQADLKASMQQFGRYMEAGVLRKEDEIKYEKMFPQVTDTQDLAINKLAVVRRLLVAKQKGDLAALKKAGFDVTPFRKFEGEVIIPAFQEQPSGGGILGGQPAAADEPDLTTVDPAQLSTEQLNLLEQQLDSELGGR